MKETNPLIQSFMRMMDKYQSMQLPSINADRSRVVIFHPVVGHFKQAILGSTIVSANAKELEIHGPVGKKSLAEKRTKTHNRVIVDRYVRDSAISTGSFSADGLQLSVQRFYHDLVASEMEVLDLSCPLTVGAMALLASLADMLDDACKLTDHDAQIQVSVELGKLAGGVVIATVRAAVRYGDTILRYQIDKSDMFFKKNTALAKDHELMDLVRRHADGMITTLTSRDPMFRRMVTEVTNRLMAAEGGDWHPSETETMIKSLIDDVDLIIIQHIHDEVERIDKHVRTTEGADQSKISINTHALIAELQEHFLTNGFNEHADSMDVGWVITNINAYYTVTAQSVAAILINNVTARRDENTRRFQRELAETLSGQ